MTRRSVPLRATSWTRSHSFVIVSVADESSPLVARTCRSTSVASISGTGSWAVQLGAGITRPGRAYLNLGSGVVSWTYCDSYSYAKEYRVLSGAVPRSYTLETFIGGGTYNIAWFVEKFAGVDPRALGLDLSPEQVLETAAAQLPPGAEGLLALPYWTGALTPYWDHHARGALVGLTGSHGKSHVYRALLEGIAYEQRLLSEGAEAALEHPVTEIVALGGGSRSPVWCQIIADVLQRSVHVVRQPESTSLGAGILAATAAGLYPSIEAAADAMTGTSAEFTPDPARAKAYQGLYEVYRSLYPALRDLFPRLARAGSP